MKMITNISAIFFMTLDSMHHLLPPLFIFHLNFQFLYEMPHLFKFLNFSNCLIIPGHSKPGFCGFCEFALILITEVPLRTLCVSASILFASNGK